MMFRKLVESIVESVDCSGILASGEFKKRCLDAVEDGIGNFCVNNGIDLVFVDYVPNIKVYTPYAIRACKRGRK